MLELYIRAYTELLVTKIIPSSSTLISRLPGERVVYVESTQTWHYHKTSQLIILVDIQKTSRRMLTSYQKRGVIFCIG